MTLYFSISWNGYGDLSLICLLWPGSGIYFLTHLNMCLVTFIWEPFLRDTFDMHFMIWSWEMSCDMLWKSISWHFVDTYSVPGATNCDTLYVTGGDMLGNFTAHMLASIYMLYLFFCRIPVRSFLNAATGDRWKAAYTCSFQKCFLMVCETTCALHRNAVQCARVTLVRLVPSKHALGFSSLVELVKHPERCNALTPLRTHV